MRTESLLALACALFLAPQLVRAEATRLTYPSAGYVELGGRGLGYGAGFDRVIADDFAVGVGIGMTPTEDLAGNSANKSALMFPAYLNYYLVEDGSTIFLTGGMTFVASDVKGLQANYSGVIFPSSRQVLPTLGWGFESRGDQGFLFRVSGYGIWGQKIQPWVGFSFGYSL
jgi:hypothetical protein